MEVVDSDSFNDKFPSPAEMLMVEPDHTIKAVIMGYDHRLNYMKVAYASMLLKDRDAAFVVTNKDVILPGQTYDLPGRRALVEGSHLSQARALKSPGWRRRAVVHLLTQANLRSG